jgi:hypothetical protein
LSARFTRAGLSDGAKINFVAISIDLDLRPMRERVAAVAFNSRARCRLLLHLVTAYDIRRHIGTTIAERDDLAKRFPSSGSAGERG